MHGIQAVEDRPSKTRSKMTNRLLSLRAIDGRSAEARRYRDLCEGFAAAFGTTPPGEREMALIRQAAALTVQAEKLQSAIVRGEDVDLEQLTRLTNVTTRTLKELGLYKRRRQKPPPTLREYIAAKQQEAGP
jgi:hypothetical protein